MKLILIGFTIREILFLKMCSTNLRVKPERNHMTYTLCALYRSRGTHGRDWLDPMATRDIPLFMKEMFLDVGWRCFSWLLRGDLWFGFLSNPMALLYRTCHECNFSGVLFRRGQFMSLSSLNSFFNSFLNLVDHYSGISKNFTAYHILF